MAEEKKNPERDLQNIFLRDRKKLLITGVHNVDSFNEECIVVDTDLGLIVVRGIDMHINKLDVEGATLMLREKYVIEYPDQTIPQRKGGISVRIVPVEGLGRHDQRSLCFLSAMGSGAIAGFITIYSAETKSNEDKDFYNRLEDVVLVITNFIGFCHRIFQQ